MINTFGEPKPIQNDRKPSWETVIERMKARDQFGRTKYGTPLQPFNGRNSLNDASEELLDLIVYLQNFQTEMESLREDLESVWSLCDASEQAQNELSRIFMRYPFLRERS